MSTFGLENLPVDSGWTDQRNWCKHQSSRCSPGPSEGIGCYSQGENPRTNSECNRRSRSPEKLRDDTQVSGPGAWSHLRVDSGIVDGGKTEVVGLARWCGKKRGKVKVLKSREN